MHSLLDVLLLTLVIWSSAVAGVPRGDRRKRLADPHGPAADVANLLIDHLAT